MVDASGRSPVDLYPELVDMGISLLDRLERAVLRAVVHHYDLELPVVERREAGQGLKGQIPAVVVENDGGDLSLHYPEQASSGARWFSTSPPTVQVPLPENWAFLILIGGGVGPPLGSAAVGLWKPSHRAR